MEKLFRTPPVKYKAKDGSGKRVIVEHRVGKVSGAFRKKDLLMRTKLEKEWTDLYAKYQKKIRDRREFEKIMDGMWKTQCDKLQRMIRAYRVYLEKFYASQEAFPMFIYVPIDDMGTMGLYLQGLLDANSESLLVGKPEDAALWTEVTQIRTKPIKERNLMSLRVAKQLMKLPGVNKDIQHRMKMVTSGNLPNSPRMIGRSSE